MTRRINIVQIATRQKCRIWSVIGSGDSGSVLVVVFDPVLFVSSVGDWVLLVPPSTPCHNHRTMLDHGLSAIKFRAIPPTDAGTRVANLRKLHG